MMKRLMTRTALVAVPLTLLVGTIAAHEGDIPRGMPRFDHVFVIMMENHGYSQIINNPNAPFINKYAKQANTADNYFAIAHPSLTNYLEVVGGSNFNVLSDNNPDWHNPTCTPNLLSGQTNIDVPALQHPQICPIAGSGMDAPTPALDPTPNEGGSALKPLINIDGDPKKAIPAAPTVGKTIGDQLVAAGLSWKSYQESLPPSGPDGVNFADGFFTDSSDIPGAIPGEMQTLIKLYAAKHNPFVYFQSVQEGHDPRNSLKNVVPFSGSHGLYADLASGTFLHWRLSRRISVTISTVATTPDRSAISIRTTTAHRSDSTRQASASATKQSNHLSSSFMGRPHGRTGAARLSSCGTRTITPRHRLPTRCW